MIRIASGIGWLPWRILRRFAVANVCCVFAAKFADLQTTALPDGMVFTELSAAMLDDLRRAYPNQFNDEHRSFLEDDQRRGFVVFENESMASFLWLASGNIPGELNHDGNQATKLPLFLPSEMGYIFNVFVMPEYRGRRLYGAMISELSKRLAQQDLVGLVLTTEGSNYRALRSVRRMGFQLIGRSMLVGIGGLRWAKYPSQPLPGGIRLGRYASARGAPQS